MITEFHPRRDTFTVLFAHKLINSEFKSTSQNWRVPCHGQISLQATFMKCSSRNLTKIPFLITRSHLHQTNKQKLQPWLFSAEITVIPECSSEGNFQVNFILYECCNYSIVSRCFHPFSRINRPSTFTVPFTFISHQCSHRNYYTQDQHNLREWLFIPINTFLVFLRCKARHNQKRALWASILVTIIALFLRFPRLTQNRVWLGNCCRITLLWSISQSSECVQIKVSCRSHPHYNWTPMSL